jgi:hypothetical protein
MIQLEKILRLLFVKPFYTENAGAFVLVFTMMFVIVGSTHGYGLYAYHRSLAVGMLSNTGFLPGVFVLWFLYVRKYVSYIAETMHQLAFGFIDVFNRLDKAKRFFLFATVQLWLLLPIILYAAFVISIGIEEKYYLPIVSIILYLLMLCLAGAAWHVYRLDNLNKAVAFPRWKAIGLTANFSDYTYILLGFVAKKQKAVFAGIKIFTCGILYLVARNNSATDYDISLPFLFFNFGVLANGIVIYRIRQFELDYLSFYRGLPVSLLKRLCQYSLVYLALLLPEFITAGLLAPVHLHYYDAVSFGICAFSLLLLINTICQLQHFSRKEFAAVLLFLFALQYVLMLVAGLTALCVFFLLLAVLLFLFGYNKYNG